MRLRNFGKLQSLWADALNKGANVILMRHAPKAGSDNSDLSEEGRRLAIRYGNILRLAISGGFTLACTSKDRTARTLKYMFPFSDESIYLKPLCLEVNKVSPFVQAQADDLHRKIGRFRSYLPNHTYYFLEKLPGEFGEKSLHTIVSERMAAGIKNLFDIAHVANAIIYCGHSPAIEVGCEKLLRLSLSELGGFLNPLDSIHLKMVDGKIEWVARINPIVDYVDLENETYF